MNSVRKALLLFLALVLFLYERGPARAEDLVLFAASSLTDVVSDLTLAYEQETGLAVKTAFASSARLARKIELGGNIDVFLSANRLWVQYLVDQGFVNADQTRPVAGNRLVLIAATAPLYPPPQDFSNLQAALSAGRLAIGNPDTAPVGRYARQALEKAGLWPDVKDRIAPMPNARAVLAMVERGEVVAGIVYATDAQISNRVQVIDDIPPDYHSPITYTAAIVSPSEPGGPAAAFIDFLSSSKGQAIIARHGFAPITEVGQR